MKELGLNAKSASNKSYQLSTKIKNKLLEKVKQLLDKNRNVIIENNKKDIEEAKVQNISEALIDRLMLDNTRITLMIDGITDIIELEDPIGLILESGFLENGVSIEKISVPLGVIGIIYESRPNVTIDAFSLCFKAGNAVILKGGKEAIFTNTILESLVREALKSCGLDENYMQLIKDTSRASTLELMKMNDSVDVLIPRGSQALINVVLKESSIPVIQTGAGNCHIYVDESADLEMALNIVKNAKLQRPGVCNAVESLVVHKAIVEKFVNMMIEAMPQVDFYGDAISVSVNDIVKEASDDDFYEEYLRYAMSIKVVDSVEEAVEHINKHHTGHSDAIITNNEGNADYFTQVVDASAVYVNASTRFTDGAVFGLGAEIGISTQKLHARGPMGLKALTSYKYILKGKGQIR